MPIEDRFATRLDILIERANVLRGDKQRKDESAGWRASASNIINQLCHNPDNAYRLQIESLIFLGANTHPYEQIADITSLLKNLKEDAEAGLLSSVANQARAEAFDDFLDHAKDYCKQNKHKEAGVISGVVFEDTIRGVCRKYGIAERDVKLDFLISELEKHGTLTATKAKRARVAAHLRTKATHAQWEEFDLQDVRTCIDITGELISQEID